MTSAQRPTVLDRHNALAVVRRLFGLGLLALSGVIVTLSLIAVLQLVSRSQILEGRQVTLLAREVNTLLLDRQAGVRGYFSRRTRRRSRPRYWIARTSIARSTRCVR